MPLMTLTEYGAIRTMHEHSPEDFAQLERRLRVRDRQLDAVRQISSALYSQNSIDNLLQETLTVALRTVDAETGSILLYDPDIKRLKFRYWTGSADLGKVEIDPETDVQGKAASVFRSGRPLITHDTQTEGYNPAIDKKTGFHTRNMLTVPVIDMDGTVFGVLQAVNKRYEPFSHDDSDLLEIISSQAAVFLANARLAQEAQLSAVARAVGDISHDIKNYLTPIETAMETLDQIFVRPLFEQADAMYEEWQPASPTHSAALEELLRPLRDEFPYTVEALQDGCSDIKELVSEIADYIKGASALNRETAEIGMVISERLRRLRTVANQRRVTLLVDGESDVPAFAFDKRLVGRAVYNLANNALAAINDAVKRGVLELRPRYHVQVRLSVVEDESLGRCCQIEVEDDGYGIPDHVKAVLFTPQAISTTPGGTGIGTRFVKDVVDRHSGRVGVDSELGKGARFWMRLPMG